MRREYYTFLPWLILLPSYVTEKTMVGQPNKKSSRHQTSTWIFDFSQLQIFSRTYLKLNLLLLYLSEPWIWKLRWFLLYFCKTDRKGMNVSKRFNWNTSKFHTKDCLIILSFRRKVSQNTNTLPYSNKAGWEHDFFYSIVFSFRIVYCLNTCRTENENHISIVE